MPCARSLLFPRINCSLLTFISRLSSNDFKYQAFCSLSEESLFPVLRNTDIICLTDTVPSVRQLTISCAKTDALSPSFSILRTKDARISFSNKEKLLVLDDKFTGRYIIFMVLVLFSTYIWSSLPSIHPISRNPIPSI